MNSLWVFSACKNITVEKSHSEEIGASTTEEVLYGDSMINVDVAITHKTADAHEGGSEDVGIGQETLADLELQREFETTNLVVFFLGARLMTSFSGPSKANDSEGGNSVRRSMEIICRLKVISTNLQRSESHGKSEDKIENHRDHLGKQVREGVGNSLPQIVEE